VRFDVVLPDLEIALQTLLAQIPGGRVTTYGDLADALGLRSAARWVGEYLREHPHTESCACYRVVRKGGELGLYVEGRDPSEKTERLKQEGLTVRDGRVERFEEVVFRDFRSDRPLARLIEFQHELARRVEQIPRADPPRVAAGLDVSYGRDRMATGACAVVESETGHVVWTATHRAPAGLPYIPSLLTFRELPMLLTLFERSRREFSELDLYFVDGNGILHPRGAGVAACFGVIADVPTIGVAKSLLCGRLASGTDPENPAPENLAGENLSGGSARPTTPVTIEGVVVGQAWSRTPTSRPLYISPGQKIDVPSATRWAQAFTRCHRLPEPLYWADRLSRAESRRGGR
jgi:deoxyribonuclease V